MKKILVKIEYRDEEDRIVLIKSESYETRKSPIDILALFQYIGATLLGE